MNRLKLAEKMSPNEAKLKSSSGLIETVAYDKDGMIQVKDQHIYFPIAIVGAG